MINKTYIKFLIIFYFITIINLNANNSYLFDYITSDQGLSSPAVTSIQQDSKGFLWFGTQSGLNYFNGYEFKTFFNDPFNSNSLSNDLVQSLYIDDTDTVWAGTYNGVSKLDIKTSHFTNYIYDNNNENSLSSDVVTAIVKDDEGYLWIATLDGLNRLDPLTDNIKRYLNREDKPNSLMNNVVRSIFVDNNSRIWIGNLSGLDLYNPKSDDFIHYPYIENKANSLPSPYVMSIIEKDSNTLLIGTWGGGVSEFNIETKEFKTISLPDNRIYTLAFDKNGFLWAGSWGGGLFVINLTDESYTHIQKKNIISNSITSDTISSIFIDKDGISWVGTNGGGINKLNYQKQDFNFLKYSKDEKSGLPSGKIDSILKDKDGNFWVSTYNGGITRYNPITKLFKTYKHSKTDSDSLSSDIVNDIKQDHLGNIWITSNDGLYRFSPLNDNFDKIGKEYFKENNITPTLTRIIEDNNNNLWIGSYHNGLLKFDIELDIWVNYKFEKDNINSLSDNLIRTILKRQNGEIWVGTNNGLNVLDEKSGKFKRYILDPNNPQSINNNNIRTLLEDQNSNLWIGTSGGGVMLYNDTNDTFKHYTTNDGLSNNYIMSMVEGSNNNIWVGTKYGISIIDSITGNIKNIKKEDGLINMDFSEGILVDDDKNIYLGSLDRISIFKKQTEIKQSPKPNVYIESIDLGGTLVPNYSPYEDIKVLEVKYKDAMYITFNFVGLNFLNPSKTNYTYKLDGFDRDWVYSKDRRFAIYTNLSPGKYTMFIKAQNQNGEWSETTAIQQIQINPPYWRTWWAYLIYVLFIATFIYLLSVFKVSEDRKKRVALLEQLNIENKKLSITDPLTNIYNRRYLESRLQKEISSAYRDNAYITVIMIDIDNFKQYNDRNGHQAGDRCLINVVNVIKNILNRPDDMIARYGGEEFCIILPRTDVNGAKKISKKIQKGVEKLTDVTISIGVHSSIPTEIGQHEDFLKIADNALYLAKDNGRNRYEII